VLEVLLPLLLAQRLSADVFAALFLNACSLQQRAPDTLHLYLHVLDQRLPAGFHWRGTADIPFWGLLVAEEQQLRQYATKSGAHLRDLRVYLLEGL